MRKNLKIFEVLRHYENKVKSVTLRRMQSRGGDIKVTIFYRKQTGGYQRGEWFGGGEQNR